MEISDWIWSERLQRLGQWGSPIALGTVGVTGLVMAVSDPPVGGAHSRWGIVWIRQERSAYLALSAICLLLVSVGIYYGSESSRKIAAVFVVFGLFFLNHAGLLVFRDHLAARFRTVRYTLVPIIEAACVVAGAFAFTRVGEERPDEETEARCGVGSGAASHLARQLSSVNKLVLGVL